MGTVTLTAATFSALGSTPPANWPSATVTFPAGGSPNGSKEYGSTTPISDAAWLELLTWVASNQLAVLESITGTTATPGNPITPTAAQLLLAWVQIWINGTITAVQQANITPPVTPAPITIV